MCPQNAGCRECLDAMWTFVRPFSAVDLCDAKMKTDSTSDNSFSRKQIQSYAQQ